MESSINLDRLEIARERLQARHQVSPEPESIADEHVSVLKECFDSPIVACLLEEPAGSAVRLKRGKATRAQMERLCEWVRTPSPDQFPQALKLEGLKPVVIELSGYGRRWGRWVLAAPPRGAEKHRLALWGLSQAAVGAMHERLSQESLRACRQDLAEQRQLCVLADLISPVAHELQNVLNSMLLQAAIVERSAPAAIKDDLQKIRSLGVQAGEVMKRFNHYRYGQSLPRYSVDLVKVIEDRAAAIGDDAIRIDLSLPDTPLCIRGTRTDVERLTDLLLKQAVDATSARDAGGTVRCEARVEDERVLLLVTDSGGAVPPDELKGLFQTSGEARSGVGGMELLACQSLARRMGGVLRAEGVQDGLAMQAEFERAASPGAGDAEK